MRTRRLLVVPVDDAVQGGGVVSNHNFSPGETLLEAFPRPGTRFFGDSRHGRGTRRVSIALQRILLQGEAVHPGGSRGILLGGSGVQSCKTCCETKRMTMHSPAFPRDLPQKIPQELPQEGRHRYHIPSGHLAL